MKKLFSIVLPHMQSRVLIRYNEKVVKYTVDDWGQVNLLNQILIPFDGSETAEVALPYAAELACAS
ncbi:MAG: hypothetical protein PHS35_03935, partial [Dehalococcoidales bacterium]|nr:hypothetical protein [Dehalococcoidales bacterium]